jgi:voltage-gated potassium channel
MIESTGSMRAPESAGLRETGAMLVRITVAVSALLLGYFQIPIDDRSDLGRHLAAAAVGIVVFGGIFVRQMRQIRKAQFPVLRAVEAVALVATLFVVVMAGVHYGLGQSDPAAYSEGLSRLDALYFTVSTLATVGFGDITPATDVARVVTTVQMVLGVALLGAGIRVLLGVARMVAEERRGDTR